MRSLLPTLRPSSAARLFVARMAMLAVLATALLPGISRLLQPTDLWGSLCQSTQAEDAASDPPSPTLPAGHEHGDACALCTLAHTTPTLATPAPTVTTEATPMMMPIKVKKARSL